MEETISNIELQSKEKEEEKKALGGQDWGT